MPPLLPGLRRGLHRLHRIPPGRLTDIESKRPFHNYKTHYELRSPLQIRNEILRGLSLFLSSHLIDDYDQVSRNRIGHSSQPLRLAVDQKHDFRK